MEQQENSAYYYKRKTLNSVAASLKDIFDQIDMAATSGKYSTSVKEDLSDVQLDVLQDLGFEITPHDDGDDEFDLGYKYLIEWERADDQDEYSCGE